VHLVGFIIRTLSHNCKLFRDPDGENNFLEIKYVSINAEIIILKKIGTVH